MSHYLRTSARESTSAFRSADNSRCRQYRTDAGRADHFVRSGHKKWRIRWPSIRRLRRLPWRRADTDIRRPEEAISIWMLDERKR